MNKLGQLIIAKMRNTALFIKFLLPRQEEKEQLLLSKCKIYAPESSNTVTDASDAECAAILAHRITSAGAARVNSATLAIKSLALRSGRDSLSLSLGLNTNGLVPQGEQPARGIVVMLVFLTSALRCTGGAAMFPARIALKI